MKIHLGLAICAAAYLMPGAVSQVNAQQQITESVQCRSTPTTRSSCPVQGEILSAGISQRFGEAPCFLGFTWGFEENGIWTSRGCSADFAVTVELPQAQPVADPQILRDRLRNTREKLREARAQITREQEERRVLETELADAQEALRRAEAGKPANKGKRRPRNAVRAVSSCSNRARRDATKGGAEKARVVEIVSARPSEGAWLVIGRLRASLNGESSSNYFRCWTQKGKVITFENSI